MITDITQTTTSLKQELCDSTEESTHCTFKQMLTHETLQTIFNLTQMYSWMQVNWLYR